MIRRYKKGEALAVQVQAAQIDEAAEAYGFDMIKAYTLLDDNGEILAVFGYRDAGCGVMECFMLASAATRYKIIELFRFLNRSIPRIMRRQRFVRAMMTVKEGFKAGEKMAHMLGFKVAEKLPLFYSGNNYQIFERTISC